MQQHRFFLAAISGFIFFMAPVTRLAADPTMIHNKGSETLVTVAQSWADAYQKIQPNVAVVVSGGGTGSGIAAMISGTVDIANASRTMTNKEFAKAKAAGQNPVEHAVGYDALTIFLHRDNPLQILGLDQLAQIFGRDGKITKWSALGVKVPGCGSDSIVLVSHQNNSGTYAYFKEAVLEPEAEKGHLAKGGFRQGTLDMHGAKDVVDLVEKTPCAIGYSGLAYATDHIRKACISKQAGEPCFSPTMETAIDNTYPIARPLFMYTNGAPKEPIKDYLDWILSDAGQCVIYDKGYAPARQVKCK